MLRRGFTIVAITLVSLEITLRVLNPFGAWNWRQTLRDFSWSIEQDHLRGYILQEGSHRMPGGWEITVVDHERSVPATTPDDACSIAFVGDSVTMGLGVNDDETFVNRLAIEYPDVHFRNLGVNGYNAEQVLATIDLVEANAYIWLAIYNDAHGQNLHIDHAASRRRASAMAVYARHAFSRPAPQQSQYVATLEVLERLDENVRIVAFNDGSIFTSWITERAPSTIIIPIYQGRISPADGHPDVTGHREIAAALSGEVASLIEQYCGPSS